MNCEICGHGTVDENVLCLSCNKKVNNCKVKIDPEIALIIYSKMEETASFKNRVGFKKWSSLRQFVNYLLKMGLLKIEKDGDLFESLHLSKTVNRVVH